jgi:hypothetical protein
VGRLLVITKVYAVFVVVGKDKWQKKKVVVRVLNLVPSRLRYREKGINTEGRSIPILGHGTVPIVLGIDMIPPKSTDQYQNSL